MLRRATLLTSVCVLFFSLPARSEEIVAQGYRVFAPTPSLLGVGMAQSSTSLYSAVGDLERHFKQRKGLFEFRQYGEAQSRIEVGHRSGLSVKTTAGITLVGLDRGESVSAHFGLEIFSGRFTVQSWPLSSQYEWLPMASVGPQFEAGSCRLLPLLRAGGGVGNLGKSGMLPALTSATGAAGYLDCNRFSFSGELTRLNLSNPVQFAVADFSAAVQKDKLEIGLRAERTIQSGQSGDLDSKLMLVVRSRIFDFLSGP